jgi:hypothetical protein
MKFGPKPLVLLNNMGNQIHPRYRYKFPPKAIFRAIVLPEQYIQIWDLEQGKELCYIAKTRNTITIAKVR